MLVIALATLIVESNEAPAIQDIDQAILEGMVAGWHRAMQLPYFHLDQPAIGQALTVLLEQFGLHVGILDNNLREVKQQALLIRHVLYRIASVGRQYFADATLAGGVGKVLPTYAH